MRLGQEQLAEIKAFKRLAEAVFDEPIDPDTLVGLVVQRGLRALVEDLIGQIDRETLLASIVQMSQENPEFVFSFLLDRLQRGAAITKGQEELAKQEAERRRLGFRKPRR